MNVRATSGLIGGMLLFALAAIPHSIHTHVCSPYAAKLGINPGPPTPDSPYGITACDDFSVTAIGDAPFALATLVLCIIASVLLVRFAGFRSVTAVVATGVAAAFIGSFCGLLYSGHGFSELVTDGGVRFSLLVVTVTAAVMASLELRRLPNNSLERTREE